MGEAKLKAQRAPAMEALDRNMVASAVRQVVSAITGFQGADCLLYAHVGAGLLRSLGIPVRAVAGSAVWRVGDGDSDILSHAREVNGQAYLPDDPYCPAAMFHAWIEGPRVLIDFSTCSLRDKAAALDAADGGRTNVLWAPEFLWTEPKATNVMLHDAMAVVQAPKAGVCYYRRHPDIEQFVFAEDLPVSMGQAIFAAQAAYSASLRGDRLQIIGVDENGDGQVVPAAKRFVPVP